jgi:hypothetical protein
MEEKMKKYKLIRIPTEAYEKEKRKANEMNNRLSEITKKPRRIPMTQYFKFRAERPMFIYDDELINYFTKSKRKYLSL